MTGAPCSSAPAERIAPRMNVLVVTNAYPTVDQPSRGVFVRTQIESLREAGVGIQVEAIRGDRRRADYLLAVARVRRRAAAGGFDLCHAHYGLSGLVALLQRRLPVVVSFMGDDVYGTPRADGAYGWPGRLVAWLGRHVAQRADAVIVKSEALRNVLGRRDAYVIPNGVDLARFRPLERTDACHRLGLDPAGRHVLFTGLPELAVKDHPLARETFARVQAREPAARFLEASRVPHEEMPWYYNAADVLLLTSRHEGSPNSVKEAMACNLPVVSVDVGDVRKIVGTTECCSVVDARDPEALSAAVLEVLRAPCRTHGREAVAELALEKIARQVLSVYESVLRTRAGAASRGNGNERPR